MEPVRPEVEGFVLDMVERRTFRKAEFTETPDGHVRLLAPLTHELAETMPLWARSLAPMAEKVAHILGRAMDGKYQPATPLTSSRTKAAQAVVKARKVEASQRATRQQVPATPGRPRRQPCRCGAAPTAAERSPTPATSAATPASPPTLRRPLRSGAGVAPPSPPASGRSPSGRRPILDAVYDPELFPREILPRLATVKLSEIVEATGMCKVVRLSDPCREVHAARVDLGSACQARPGRYFRLDSEPIARSHLT